MTSTGAGNLGIATAYIQTSSGTNTTVSISSTSDGTSTWTHCSNCYQNTASGLSRVAADSSYSLSLASGKTSITVTVANAPGSGSESNYSISFNEYHCSGSCTITFDTSSSATRAASTTPAGIALTLGGSPNDVVFQAIAVDQFNTGVTSLVAGSIYTLTTAFSSLPGDGEADAINATTSAAPTYNQNASDPTVVFAMAFKGATSGGSSCKPELAALGTGCG